MGSPAALSFYTSSIIWPSPHKVRGHAQHTFPSGKFSKQQLSKDHQIESPRTKNMNENNGLKSLQKKCSTPLSSSSVEFFIDVLECYFGTMAPNEYTSLLKGCNKVSTRERSLAVIIMPIVSITVERFLWRQ